MTKQEEQAQWTRIDAHNDRLRILEEWKITHAVEQKHMGESLVDIQSLLRKCIWLLLGGLVGLVGTLATVLWNTSRLSGLT